MLLLLVLLTHSYCLSMWRNQSVCRWYVQHTHKLQGLGPHWFPVSVHIAQIPPYRPVLQSTHQTLFKLHSGCFIQASDWPAVGVISPPVTCLHVD